MRRQLFTFRLRPCWVELPNDEQKYFSCDRAWLLAQGCCCNHHDGENNSGQSDFHHYYDRKHFHNIEK